MELGRLAEAEGEAQPGVGAGVMGSIEIRKSGLGDGRENRNDIAAMVIVEANEP
jgi:hypothetical protein